MKIWEKGACPMHFWSNPDNIIDYMLWLKKRLKYQNMDDWYNITHKDFRSNYGGGLISHFGGSYYKLFVYIFPEKDWKPWLFGHVSNVFWNDLKNRRDYLNWIGGILQYKKMEDWYAIDYRIFDENHGKGLLSRYKSSHVKLIMEIFPEYEWKEWLFEQVPKRFWTKIENRRKYVTWLGNKLNYQSYECWYNITSKDFDENYGGGLHSYYNNCSYRLILDIFPEYDWKPWLFLTTHKGFWDIKENQIQFMSWLGNRLNYNKYDDWYSVTHDDFKKNYGTYLVQRHKSYVNLIKFVFPDYNWCEWKFKYNKECWHDRENVRRYMTWLGNKLNFHNPEDWYSITLKDFKKNYGKGMLKACYNSLTKEAVKDHFPNYQWNDWMFTIVPIGCWENKETRINYMRWLADKLNITNPEQWYTITHKDFRKHSGGWLVHYYNDNVGQCVMSNIEYDWKEEEFYQKKKMQKRLFRIIKDHFSDSIFDYKHPDMRFKPSNKKMELDIWIPSLKLGIEYQDQTHFFSSLLYCGEDGLNERKGRDAQKRAKAKEIDINFLEITYKEWNGDKEYIDNLLLPYVR